VSDIFAAGSEDDEFEFEFEGEHEKVIDLTQEGKNEIKENTPIQTTMTIQSALKQDSISIKDKMEEDEELKELEEHQIQQAIKESLEESKLQQKNPQSIVSERIEAEEKKEFINVEEFALQVPKKPAEPKQERNPGNEEKSEAIEIESSKKMLENEERLEEALLEAEEEERRENEMMIISSEEESESSSLDANREIELDLGVEESAKGRDAHSVEIDAFSSGVDNEMMMDYKILLKLFGIPFVQSPGEADAQCAELEKKGLVDGKSSLFHFNCTFFLLTCYPLFSFEGSISDDSDLFVFGSKKVYRRLFSKKHAEVYSTSKIESATGLKRIDFLNLTLLLGSDYTSTLLRPIFFLLPDSFSFLFCFVASYIAFSRWSKGNWKGDSIGNTGRIL